MHAGKKWRFVIKLIHAEEVCDKDKWISATSPYMNLLRHLIIIFQKCVTVLFYITLWMCINYRHFFKMPIHFRFKHPNRTKRQFPSERRIATKDSNLQLRRRWYLFHRGPGTSNRGMIPDPMFSSIHLSEPSWECKTSLLHNPHATIFCQCWKLQFQCARIKNDKL